MFEKFKPLYYELRSGVLILCVAVGVGCINRILGRTLVYLREGWGYQSDDYWQLPALGGVLAQTIVPLLWCVFARRLLIWRLFVFFLAIPLLSSPSFLFDARWYRALELTLPISIAAVLPLAIYRFIGQWEIVRESDLPLGNSRQLSISDIGTWTFVVAIVIAGQQHYRQSINWNGLFAGLELAIMWAIATYTFFIVIAWLPLLALLMAAPSKWRLRFTVGSILMTFSLAVAISLFQNERLLVLVAVVGFFIVFVGLSIVTLLVVKRLGYRLMKFRDSKRITSNPN